MIRIYGIVGQSVCEVDETGKGPDEGWIEMAVIRPDSTDYTAQMDGTWAITQETLNAKLAPIESQWRDQQMPIARNNVTAIQFGDKDVPGREQEWKDYWLALRKWTTDNPDFPDMTKRPIQPS